MPAVGLGDRFEIAVDDELNHSRLEIFRMVLIGEQKNLGTGLDRDGIHQRHFSLQTHIFQLVLVGAPVQFDGRPLDVVHSAGVDVLEHRLDSLGA